VNASTSERVWRGDGMVRLPRRGKLRRVSATEDDSPDLRVHDLRVAGSRKADQRIGNVVNPKAGCRVQQTCGLSRVWSSDWTSAEKTVGAGRNGKNGTCSERGSSGPKSGRRSRWEWTQGQCWQRGIDEPHERSPSCGIGLRVGPTVWTARTGMPLKRSCVRVSIR
jgi:hypothetical protein